MKNLKKLIPLLLVLVMVLSMGIPVYAAENDGSITVTNATVGKTYAAYKVFDLTYNGDKVAYTYDGTNPTFVAALKAESSPFTISGKDPGPYNVVKKDGKTAADISAFLTTNKGNLPTPSTQEASADTVTFSNLPYGYYYVTSSLGTNVTIDSTMKNVKVVDKNQGPSWDNEDPNNPDPDYPDNPGKVIVKADGTKVIENTANYGDTVNFSIAVNATAYDGAERVTYYHITDTLGTGFSEAKNIKVYVDDEEITKDTDYKLTQTGNTFNVDIPFGLKYGSDAKIEVKYSATVLDTAVLAGEGNPNTANFTWTKDSTLKPEDPDPTPDLQNPPTPSYPDENKKTTKTYVYAIGILKVDEKGNKLTGAEFTVKDSAGKQIYATGAAGVYEYCASTATDATSQFVTDANGLLVIKGVAAGEYEVTEAVAPLGYNLLLEPVSVEAVMKQAYTTTITTYYDADGNVVKQEESVRSDTTEAGANVTELVVVNNAGTELPATGGMGTTLFYIFGAVLLVGAGILLFVRKRMNE